MLKQCRFNVVSKLCACWGGNSGFNRVASLENRNIKLVNEPFHNRVLTKMRHIWILECHVPALLLLQFPQLNPFRPGGHFYLNSLDWSTSHRRGVWLVFTIIMFNRNFCI